VSLIKKKINWNKYWTKKKYITRLKLINKKKNFARRLKIFLGCQICKYKKHWSALEFDHINPSKKKLAISRMIFQGSNFESFKNEIRKCRILCANCHAIHTNSQNLYGGKKLKKNYA
tara:strand:+ start:289 stop:639 length:351 start_codon:yes stop_codon:yes gene_type:complete